MQYCNTISKSFPERCICTFLCRGTSAVTQAKDTSNMAYFPIALKAIFFITEILYFLKSCPDKLNRYKTALAELERPAHMAKLNA